MSRILTITNNLKQASYRLRIEALRDLLAARGVHLHIEVRPRKLLARRKLWRTAGEYDAVILQRKLLDRADMIRLRRHAKKIFFDVDDAVMYHNRKVGAVSRWRNWTRFKATAKRVDVVVAGNEYLAEIFRRHGSPSAGVLPTMVDPAHYLVKTAVGTELPALVWIGSKSTLPYLAMLESTLKQAVGLAPGLRLITIADETLEKSPLPTEHIAWSVSTEASALIRGDIGIAPMPEDRWTLGKCGFKILQYMAAGLPVIASPVGANREIVVPGETGFLAEDAEEWLAAIAALCGDVKLRERMGAAGRKRVEERFSLECGAAGWVRLLS